MPGPNGEKCANCYYYEEDEPRGAGYECGACHRFPASRTMKDEQDEILVPPIVHWDSWCGEFKPKGGTEAPPSTVSELCP